MAAIVWKPEKVKVDDLIENPDNPKIISEQGRSRLQKSLSKFGLAGTIVVNKDLSIIDGHSRKKELLEQGIKEVWVSVPSRKLTEAEYKEFNAIFDVAKAGEPDLMLMEEILGEEFMEEWELNGKPQVAEEDNYEIPAEIETDIVLGDLFEIGPHRLLCGDSTNADDVGRLLGEDSVEIIYTDPPYSSGGSQESGKTSGSIGARGGKTIKNDNLSTRGYKLLMNDALSICNSAHSLFIFCDWKMWIETFDLAERIGFRVRNMLVWDKMQMGMGMPFRNQHELCLFASKIAGKIGDGSTPNVLQYKRDRDAEHATPKPIELISQMLKQVDSANVYDPFLGGGSTMVAAHQLNRKCYGMEIDPKYCQVVINRMLKLCPDIKIKRNGREYTGKPVAA